VILAVDQGTTGTTCLVVDEDLRIRGRAYRELTQHFPRPGWVEHDASEIWTAQISVAVEALGKARIGPKDVAAVGITNQRETAVVWDRQTGEPVCKAIVWQDRRTAPFCDRLRADGHEKLIRDKTGLVIDAYFSGSKVAWILDNVPGARDKAEAGKLAFGTIDTWLVWKLTDGKLHVTDSSNASRTMLYDIHRLDWDLELLDRLDIPTEVLPGVMASSGTFGMTDPERFLGTRVPISGIAGDQQAALFGQACFSPGAT
jgi:glycerol kinase